MKKATSTNSRIWLLLLSALGGCFSDSAPGPGLECGPRDFTTDCCIKKNPGAYEQCLGGSDTEGKVVAFLLAASTRHDGRPAPQYDPDDPLEPQLRRQLDEVLERCARLADQQINDKYLGGKSPDARRCSEEAPNGQEMAAWLGRLKHAAAKECLELNLPKHIPPQRFLLEIRFHHLSGTAEWKPFKNQAEFDQAVNSFGWQVFSNIIAPDVVILDPTGTRVVAIYDFKFPCPETNPAKWDIYKGQHYWSGTPQNVAWHNIFRVSPRRVSPAKGVEL